jgi:hypothetical protein
MKIRPPVLLVPRHLAHRPDPQDLLLRNVHTYVHVEIPFPEDHASVGALQAILQGIPQDVALSVVCIANRELAAPTGEKRRARQQRLLTWLATQEDIERINWFMRGKPGAPLFPFFRGQMLELLRWILLFCPDESSDIDDGLADADIRRKLFKAALMTSEIWGQRTSEQSIVADGVFFGEKALAYSRASVDSNAMAPDLWRSLGRARTLFGEYVPSRWRRFGHDFQSRSGLTILNYQACAAAIVASYMIKRADKGLMALPTFAEHLVDNQVMNAFMQLTTSTRQELARSIWTSEAIRLAKAGEIPEMNTKPLRERPIVRINDDLGAILDPIYFSDVLLIGPLFVTVRGMPQGDSNARFGNFGRAFETYVLDTLKRVLGHDKHVSNPLRRNVPILDLEIDGLAQAGHFQFAFEVKSLFIKESEIVPRDPDLYIQILRSRYVFDADSDRPHKAVSQLVRVVRALEAEMVRADEADRLRLTLVFPIMVVHDELLSAPLHGRFLAVEFRERLAPQELLPSGQMRLNSSLRVAPLIVLTVADIEDLESSAGAVSFTQAVSEYSSALQDRELSFHDFIAGSPFASLMAANPELAKHGTELFRQTGLRLFGKDPTAESSVESEGL